MLNRLYVKNFALIVEANIEFDEKLNVLSGETGAGKSVILDSINFVLGSKADKSQIRYGAEQAFVKAEFTVDERSAAARVLEELDVECDGSIIISRKYSIDGRGSIKINGSTVTAAMLKSVTAHLVDVHGQSEHFFLLSEANQLTLVDQISGEKLTQLKQELGALIAKKKEGLKQISELGGSEQERTRKLDLLSYQIDEIERAEIKSGEYDQLIATKKLIENAERIISSVNTVKSILSDDDGVVDRLSLSTRVLLQISDFDGKYAEIADRLDSLLAEAQDISDTVSDFADDLSFDGDKAQYVEERLSLLKSLFKKYGKDEDEVLEFLSIAKKQFDELNDAAATIDRLNAQISDLNGKIYSLCQKITKIRKGVCDSLSKSVENELKSLNIPAAKFAVDFAEYDFDSADLNSPNGTDKISFAFSANKGEPLKPLNKVISGGEMSRLMLALKAQFKVVNGISTYIFDEIDAGISGVTAKAVADKFISIGNQTQIIAVSHLPQICASASAAYLIYKVTEDGKTLTRIKRLNRAERIEEIVRLTGSVHSEAASAHADELLKQFGN